MEIVRCENGHFYDIEKYSSCPTCAKELSGVGATVPATMPASIPATMPATMPASEMPFISSQMLSDYGSTEPVSAVDFTPEMVTDTKAAAANVPNVGIQDYQPTMPVLPQNVGEDAANTAFNPVVGWLVCVEGPDKGKDYRIHSQNNFIGRAPHMDICIRSDMHVSNERAAMIAYDPDEKMFLFGPGTGHNLVKVNGKTVLNTVELNPFDKVTVGKSKLLFVPLCGERFNWDAE